MKIIIGTIALIFCFSNLVSQTISIEEAIRNSQSQNFELAEKQFQQLATDGNIAQTKLILHRAYNYSWWRKFEMANTNFRQLLNNNDYKLEATIGLAYNETWAGHHANAVQFYIEALKMDPVNNSALTGLTFNYIEKRNVTGAKSMLNRIRNVYPPNEEYYYLAGLIAVLELKQAKAREAFKQSLAINPNYQIAKEKLDEYTTIPNKFSLGIWHGSSSINNKLTHSLRRMDMLYQHSPRLLLLGSYDNSLALQNRFLQLKEQNAPVILLGGKYGITKKWHAKLEFGKRLLKTQKDELLINLENIYFLSSEIVLKAYLNYNHGAIDQLLTYGLGADVALAKGLRTNFAYFLTNHIEQSQNRQHRFIISPKYSFNNIELTGGVFYDKFETESISTGKFAGYFGMVAFPIMNRLDGRFFAQRDIGVFDDPSFLISAGLNFKF